ncbi:MAG: hypothetical protein R6T83_07010 [Salinibacter sp.]
MPATTTQRSTTATSPLVTAALCLALAAFSLAPVSCGTESDDPSGEETSQAEEADSNRAILLNIGIEDETSDRPLSDAFVIEPPSGERWAPGVLDGGGATKAFEKHPIGETRTLRLYPEGKDGHALEVPITMKPAMSSALASSRTDIFVYDDSIVVSGPAVPDKEIVFDRE